MATVSEGATFNYTSPVDAQQGVDTADVASIRIYFFDSDPDSTFDPDTLAAAFVTFDVSTGEIVSCDIAFSDIGVLWSASTPSDPNQYLGFDVADIEEAANQEIMHCFGFDHSPIAGRFDALTGLQVVGRISGDFSLQASIFPQNTGTIQGRTFETDDIAAFSTLYPSGTVVDPFGVISGQVLQPSGSGVKGAHVVAVPANDVTLPLVGTLSGVDSSLLPGEYRLSRLVPGSYFVRVEPLVGTSNPFTEDDILFTGLPDKFRSGIS